MSKEISNTLFRMVNTRNPKKVKEADRELYFVIRPEKSPLNAKGDFDAHLVANTENLTNWQKLVNYCPTFSATAKKKSLDDIIKIQPQLYNFGVWISRNSENETLENLSAKRLSFGNNLTISLDNLKILWDNFIYQVVTQEDFETKEAVMQLLKGHHVYNKLNTTTDPQLKAIADNENRALFKCKVVFPDLFDVRENVVGSRTTTSRKKHDQRFVSEDAKKKYAFDLAQMRLKSCNLLKTELEDYQKSFQKGYNKAYEKTKSAYDRDNQPALDAYYQEVEAAKLRWCENKPAVEYNPNDPCHQPPSVPYPTLPSFEFDYPEDVSHATLKEQLSDGALTTLYYLLKDSTPAKRKFKIDEKNIDVLFKDIDSFEDLFEIVNKAIDQAQNVEPLIIEETPQRRLVEVNGVFMPVNLRTSNTVDFRLSFIPITTGVPGDGGVGIEPSPFDGNGEAPNNIIRNMGNNLMTIKLEIFDSSGNFVINNADFYVHFGTNTNWQANNYSLISSNTYQINFLDQWYLNRFGLNEFNSMLSISANINFENNKIGSFIIEQFDFSYVTGNIYFYQGTMNLKNEHEVFVPVLNHLPISENSAKLLWNQPNEFSHFDLRYREIGQNIWQSVHADINEKVISGLVASKTYEAQVRYIFENYPIEFYNSPFSNLVTFNTIGSSGTVELRNLVASEITQNSCKLTWDAVVNAVSYDVNRVGAASINVTTNLANITGLTPNTGYTFIVSAKNAQGTTIASNSVQIKTEPASNGGTTPTTQAFVPSSFGIKQLGIADYDKVEQSTYCYIEGDVAHIENIMAREFREKTTRRLRSRTIEESETFETEREQLTDTTSTDRFEMQSEVAKIIAQSRDMQANTSFQATWGGAVAGAPSFNAGAGANFATHNSTEQSTSQAVTQAKEITERAMDRVVTKVKQERIEKILDEFEETNSHGFDNRKGDQHVVGVYRWVDKIMKNQIFTYGKRQMIEFMIPEPARLHQLAMMEAVDRGAEIIEKPKSPKDYGIHDYSFIQRNNFKNLLTIFNVNGFVPPKENIFISESYLMENWEENPHKTGTKDIVIPPDYFVENISGRGIVRHRGSSASFNNMWIRILVGGKYIFYKGNNFNEFEFSHSSFNTPIINELKLSITSWDIVSYNLNFNVKCKLKTSAYEEWQKNTFELLTESYNNKLKEYYNKIENNKILNNEIRKVNPGFYRQIENTVLRQNCIAYMVEKNPNAPLTLGKKHVGKLDPTKDLTHANFGVNQTQDLDNYTAFVKFFEQAFEWDIMSYYFYPYYWGDRDQWQYTYDFEDNDPLFRSFMQSGMARVIATVRPGFEDAVNFYFKTGLIWKGGEVPVPGDDLYISLAQEMQKPLGEKKGKPWRNRLPTALTILQADSIGLKVEKALPCACDDNETYEDNLGSFCNTNPELGFTTPNTLIGGANSSAKGTLTGNVKGLNEDDSLKVVLRNLQNQTVKMAYLYGDNAFNFTDLAVGDYDLNFDEEDFLSDLYDVTQGQVRQVVSIVENEESIVTLTIKPQNSTKPVE